jgi:hypothetical protein
MQELALLKNTNCEAVHPGSSWVNQATSLNTRKKRAFGLREYAEGKTTDPADTFQINIGQRGNPT